MNARVREAREAILRGPTKPRAINFERQLDRQLRRLIILISGHTFWLLAVRKYSLVDDCLYSQNLSAK